MTSAAPIPAVSWPPDDVFTSLDGRPQLTDGLARCTRFAICNDRGSFVPRFRQGERAHIFFEFELHGDIGAPIAGAELRDESGRIVYGKSTALCGVDVPPRATAGSILRVRQSVDLELAFGSFDVNLGLAAADAVSLGAYGAARLPYPEFAAGMREHCRVLAAAAVSVEWPENGRLLHHGTANLPGDMALEVIPPAAAPVDTPRPPIAGASAPTLLHVTHWKAGSQWVYNILQACVPEGLIEPQLDQAQVLYYPIQRGAVYPTVYLTKSELDRVALPPGARVFVVIRDLRDTLVSAYFSFKVSHPVLEPGLAALRATLEALNLEDGLLYMLDHSMPSCARIQLSWLESDAPVLRYEDLLERDAELLPELLIGRLGIPLDPERLHAAILANRFETVAGRRRGEENVAAHARKGVAGDWRNHFTERVKRAFKARYGGLLVAAGYEKHLDW